MGRIRISRRGRAELLVELSKAAMTGIAANPSLLMTVERVAERSVEQAMALLATLERLGIVDRQRAKNRAGVPNPNKDSSKT